MDVIQSQTPTKELLSEHVANNTIGSLMVKIINRNESETYGVLKGYNPTNDFVSIHLKAVRLQGEESPHLLDAYRAISRAEICLLEDNPSSPLIDMLRR